MTTMIACAIFVGLITLIYEVRLAKANATHVHLMNSLKMQFERIQAMEADAEEMHREMTAQHSVLSEIAGEDVDIDRLVDERKFEILTDEIYEMGAMKDEQS